MHGIDECDNFGAREEVLVARWAFGTKSRNNVSEISSTIVEGARTHSRAFSSISKRTFNAVATPDV